MEVYQFSEFCIGYGSSLDYSLGRGVWGSRNPLKRGGGHVKSLAANKKSGHQQRRKKFFKEKADLLNESEM